MRIRCLMAVNRATQPLCTFGAQERLPSVQNVMIRATGAPTPPPQQHKHCNVRAGQAATPSLGWAQSPYSPRNTSPTHVNQALAPRAARPSAASCFAAGGRGPATPGVTSTLSPSSGWTARKVGTAVASFCLFAAGLACLGFAIFVGYQSAQLLRAIQAHESSTCNLVLALFMGPVMAALSCLVGFASLYGSWRLTKSLA